MNWIQVLLIAAVLSLSTFNPGYAKGIDGSGKYDFVMRLASASRHPRIATRPANRCRIQENGIVICGSAAAVQTDW